MRRCSVVMYILPQAANPSILSLSVEHFRWIFFAAFLRVRAGSSNNLIQISLFGEVEYKFSAAATAAFNFMREVFRFGLWVQMHPISGENLGARE